MAKSIKYNSGYDDMYNQARNDQIADEFEMFLDGVENMCIYKDKDVDEITSAIKVVRKMIKNLRKGHPEKVFDEERFYEYLYKESE